MARSSTSSSSEVDEDISPNNVKFETDEAKFSLQPYLFEPTIKERLQLQHAGSVFHITVPI